MSGTTTAEFQIALDTHGADLSKWPAELRAEALVLLAGSAEARAVFEAARGVEGLLRRPAEQPAPQGLADRIIGMALKTPRQ